MLVQKSVHIDCTQSGSTSEFVQSEDIGVASGRIDSTDGDVSLSNLLVNGVDYFSTNTAGVLTANGISETEAERLAGEWISMRPGESAGNGNLNYATGLHGMTLASQSDALLITGSLKQTGSMVIQGVRVYGVSGGATPYYAINTSSVDSTTETVYITASGAPLPVRVSAHASNGTVTTCTFSNWNRPLDLTAPANSVPVTSI